MANSAKWLPNVEGTAKAFSSTSQTATHAVNPNSFNVSSVTDAGVGQSTFTMAVSMITGGYFTTRGGSGNYPHNCDPASVSTFTVQTVSADGNLADGTLVIGVAHGELA